MLTGAEYMDAVNLLNVYKLPVSEWAAANASRGAPFTRPNGEVLNPTYPNDRIENTRLGEDPWLYPDTDWMEAVQRKNAPTTRQNVQITGGDDNGTYLASIGYLRQDVNFKNALKRIEQQVYGSCLFCAKTISIDRLDAFPEVQTCVNCA